MADNDLQVWIAVKGPAEDEAQNMGCGLNVPAPGEGRKPGCDLWREACVVGLHYRLWRRCQMAATPAIRPGWRRIASAR